MIIDDQLLSLIFVVSLPVPMYTRLLITTEQ